MNEEKYKCPKCSNPLELYANPDSDNPADDEWSCDMCCVSFPHRQFPLPKGYVKQARAAEKAQDLQWQREDELQKLAAWNTAMGVKS